MPPAGLLKNMIFFFCSEIQGVLERCKKKRDRLFFFINLPLFFRSLFFATRKKEKAKKREKMNIKVIIAISLIIMVIIVIIMVIVFSGGSTNTAPSAGGNKPTGSAPLPSNIWIGNWSDSSNPAANMQFKQEGSVITLANTAAGQYNIPHTISGNTISFYGFTGINDGKVIDWRNGVFWTKKN